MTKAKARSDLAALEAAAQSLGNERYVFRLFVAGRTPHSARAIVNVRRFCEESLPGRFTLEIRDLLANPALAKKEQIFATPTLIRDQPQPPRRFVGDMAQMERVLIAPPPPSAGKKTVAARRQGRNG